MKIGFKNVVGLGILLAAAVPATIGITKASKEVANASIKEQIEKREKENLELEKAISVYEPLVSEKVDTTQLSDAFKAYAMNDGKIRDLTDPNIKNHADSVFAAHCLTMPYRFQIAQNDLDNIHATMHINK